MTDKIEFSECKEYSERKAKWKQAKDLYRGDKATLLQPEYLPLYEAEKPRRKPLSKAEAMNFEKKREQGLTAFDIAAYDCRRVREEITHYNNYLALSASRLSTLLFKGGLNIPKEIRDAFEGKPDIFSNIDGKKQSIETFFIKAAECHFLTGKPYIVVDSHNEQGSTAADPITKYNRAYLELIDPLNVPDWQIEQSSGANYGEYRFVRVEKSIDQPRTAISKPVSKEYCYVYNQSVYLNDAGNEYQKSISCDKYIIQDSGKQIKFEKNIPLDISLFPVLSINSTDAWCDRALPLAMKIYQKESSLDKVLHDTVYKKTYIGADKPRDINSDSDFIVYDGSDIFVGAEAKGVWESQAADPSYLMASIEANKLDMIKTVFLKQNMQADNSKAVEGAETRREVKEDLLTALEYEREQFESLINDSVAVMADFMSVDMPEERIKFAKKLTLADILGTLALVNSSFNIVSKLPTLYKALAKTISEEVAIDDEEQLDSEIAALNLDPEPLPRTSIKDLVNDNREAESTDSEV